MVDLSGSEPVGDRGPADPDAAAAEPRSTRRRPARYDLPSVQAEREERSHRLLLLVVRLLFVVLLVTVTILSIASEGRGPGEFGFSTIFGLVLATTSIGVIVLVLDAMTPNKRLSSLVSVYVGVCFGLIGAFAIGALLDQVLKAWQEPGVTGGRAAVYVNLAKVIVGIVLSYLAVSVVLTTKDDFRLVIPYVEFAKQVRGVRPLVLDTSVLIDGRINELGQTGFLDAPLVIPRFVVDELQALADSGDRTKRTRGRRGLDMVARLQGNPYVDVSIDDVRVDAGSVDRNLIELAKDQKLRIVTTDAALKKVAQINGVAVLNINDLANTLKSAALPGETLVVEVMKTGESEGQGVGYLADGTMVVIEGAAGFVGTAVHAAVTNSLQTSAGRMIFAKLEDGTPVDLPEDRSAVPHLARAATHQPRAPRPPRSGGEPPSGRNPRR